MFDLEFDLSDVRRVCDAVDREQPLMLRLAVDGAAQEALDEARRTHRYTDRTGTLTASARYRRLVFGRQAAQAWFGWTAPYASEVDEGTAPHDIRPRRAGALRFVAGGAVRFAKVVHHPGTRATGFAGQAVLTAERALVRNLELGLVRLEQIFNS